MKLELLIQNSITGTIYDVTNLSGNIQYTSELGGQPGKLTFTLQEDPKEPDDPEKLNIKNGSRVRLRVNGKGIFWGYVFTMGTDATGIYKITAYDQLRYLKNSHSKVVHAITASQLFEILCVEFSLDYEVKTPTDFIIEGVYHSNKTLYTMIDEAIQATNIAAAGEKMYFIRDDFGALIFTEISEHKTNLIIGDKSLLTSYQYEISIDKDTYNQILVTQDDEETGTLNSLVAKDPENQAYWGILQKVHKADKEENEAQMREKADDYLKFYNRETTSMKLTATGSPETVINSSWLTEAEKASVVDVISLAAGSGFTLKLDKLGVTVDTYIESITHTFTKDTHTMSMGVYYYEHTDDANGTGNDTAE